MPWQKPTPGTGNVWRLGEQGYIMALSLCVGRWVAGLSTVLFRTVDHDPVLAFRRHRRFPQSSSALTVGARATRTSLPALRLKAPAAFWAWDRGSKNFLPLDCTTAGKSSESAMHIRCTSIRESTIGLPRSSTECASSCERESNCPWWSGWTTIRFPRLFWCLGSPRSYRSRSVYKGSRASRPSGRTNYPPASSST